MSNLQGNVLPNPDEGQADDPVAVYRITLEGGDGVDYVLLRPDLEDVGSFPKSGVGRVTKVELITATPIDMTWLYG